MAMYPAWHLVKQNNTYLSCLTFNKHRQYSAALNVTHPFVCIQTSYIFKEDGDCFCWYFTRIPYVHHCQFWVWHINESMIFIAAIGCSECALTYLLPQDTWYLLFDVNLSILESSTIWAFSQYRERVYLSGAPSVMICWWFDFHHRNYMAA